MGDLCCSALGGWCALYFMLNSRMPDREALAIKYRVYDDENTCCMHCFCEPCLLEQELRHIADAAAEGLPGGPSFRDATASTNPIRSSQAASYVAPVAFAVVDKVVAGSPADAAGLREDDRVVAICGATRFKELGACVEFAAENPHHGGNVTKVLRGVRVVTLFVKPALGGWTGRLGATISELDDGESGGGSGAAK